MKLKLGKLYHSQQSLKKLLEQNFSIQTAWRLSKLAKIIDEEYSIIETNRIKLVQKYGKQKDGDILEVPIENMTDFNREMSELMNIDVEIDFDAISIQDLSEVKISPTDIANLELFLKD